MAQSLYFGLIGFYLVHQGLQGFYVLACLVSYKSLNDRIYKTHSISYFAAVPDLQFREAAGPVIRCPFSREFHPVPCKRCST